MHKENNEEIIQQEKESLDLAIKKRWEPRDLSFVSLGKGITGFFIFALLIFPASFFAMFVMQKLNGVNRPMIVPMIMAPMVETTKNPPKFAPLQNNVTVWEDMQKLRDEEHRMTTTYGVNEGNKIRIPIERAMKIVAGRGSAGLSASPNSTTPNGVPVAVGGQ